MATSVFPSSKSASLWPYGVLSLALALTSGWLVVRNLVPRPTDKNKATVKKDNRS
jgi:hypothetical protein